MLEKKENEIILSNLRLVDKREFLKNILEKTKLSKLSSEIKKVSRFARSFYNKEKNERVVTFLISLDFLTKGVLSHWQIKLAESPNIRGSSALMMKGLDIKFPMLLGDQYHTTAYFLTSRLGS